MSKILRLFFGYKFYFLFSKVRLYGFYDNGGRKNKERPVDEQN